MGEGDTFPPFSTTTNICLQPPGGGVDRRGTQTSKYVAIKRVFLTILIFLAPVG